MVMLALGGTPAAQDTPSCLSPTIVVNVRDRQKNFVVGLQASSFQVHIRDHDAVVQSVNTANGIHRIVLLVDLSGSISGDNHTWEPARAAARDLLLQSPLGLRIALVLFSDHIIDTIGFDRPSADIVERLARLEPGKGRTALFDALSYAADLLGAPMPGDAVYVVTDGGDNVSKTHPADVKSKFLSRNIRLFVFLVPSHMSTPNEVASLPDFLDLGTESGGSVLDLTAFSSRTNLNAALDRVYDEMANFYLLRLSISGRWTKRERLRINVIDSDGKKRKGVDTSVQQLLMPCVR